MTDSKQNRSEFKANFKQLPLEIKILYWVSLLFGFASVLFLISPVRHWYQEAIPYPGWHPNGGYLSIVIVMFFATLSGKILNKLDTMRKYLVFVLGITLLMGILDWFAEDSKDYYFSNPYLTYNSLHITFGIGIPLFFLLVIGGPLLKNLLNKKPEASV